MLCSTFTASLAGKYLFTTSGIVVVTVDDWVVVADEVMVLVTLDVCDATAVLEPVDVCVDVCEIDAVVLAVDD